MITFTELTLDHYDAVLALMRATPGISLREADSREATARYLDRNPGHSFVARLDGEVIGCAFCGHDGRRGYLQHVLVAPAHRRQGVGRELVKRCLDRLEAIGIYKTHLDVFATNETGQAYWRHLGWQTRADTARFSYNRSPNPNI